MDLAVVADELTAAGWRLAGARVLIPDTQGVQESFATAVRGADVVLITAELASRLPEAQLRQSLHAHPPLVLLIGDLRHGCEPPDIEDEIRRALGVPL
jgi:vacuolar-type H+-ATPase subunit F/Vma7